MKTSMRRWLTGLGLTGAVAVGSTALWHSTESIAMAHQPIAVATDAVGKTATTEEAQQAVASAKGLSVAFRVAAERVAPSVVMIETKVTPVKQQVQQRMATPNRRGNPFEGTPFEEFFGDSSPFGQDPRFEQIPDNSAPRTGIGSGVVISASGLIMTNNHVVAGGKDAHVSVRLADGREFDATNVWTDPKTDIAIVKIDADGLVPAKLGDSDQVAVGDWVLALGQPFGLEGTVTAGIVSATHRGVGITDRENFLQTDAAINPGNSGGPLVSLDGEVVGINTAISSSSGGNDGIGFAVPIKMANWVGQQLSNGGVVRRAYLGVGIQPVNASMASKFNVKPREGVVVTEVRSGTPAAKAGVQSGDVITSFAGVAITNPRDLQNAVEQAAMGKSQTITIVRDGKAMNLSFVPEEQPADHGAGAAGEQSKGGSTESHPSYESLGMELSNMDAALATKLGLEGSRGVVITDVQPGSAAAAVGLQSGMVITQVNRQTVDDVKSYESIVKSADLKEGLLLLVKSSEGSRFVILK